MAINKCEQWAFQENALVEEVGDGVSRKVLAYCDEMMSVENSFETGAVGAMHSHPHTQITYVVSGVFEFTIGEIKKIVRSGDTLLKQNGVEHGCTCIEKGILLDVFTPMRKEFVGEK